MHFSNFIAAWITENVTVALFLSLMGIFVVFHHLK